MKMDNRDKIINYYYSELYEVYVKNPLLIFGNYFLGKKLEVKNIRQVNYILEIGGANSKHLKNVKKIPRYKYVVLDPIKSDNIFIDKNKKIDFVVGTAEDIPFSNSYFDRVVGNCALHHVDDLLGALLECRRVTKINGIISFAIPTDPGILNQIIKKVFTYPALNKLSDYPAELIYALDHKNGITNILAVIRYVFKNDDIKMTYYPFLVKSHHLNLAVVVHIRRTN